MTRAEEIAASPVKRAVKLPLSYTVDMYVRPDGDVQCLWVPEFPDMTRRPMCKKLYPAYQVAIADFMAAVAAARVQSKAS